MNLEKRLEESDIKGLVVESIYLDGGGVVRINGKIRIEAVGDCCSRGWIEYLKHPPLPFTILSGRGDFGDEWVTDHSDPGHRAGCDVLTVYRASYPTDRDDLSMTVLNDSNGYYGSQVEWIGHVEASDLDKLGMMGFGSHEMSSHVAKHGSLAGAWNDLRPQWIIGLCAAMKYRVGEHDSAWDIAHPGSPVDQTAKMLSAIMKHERYITGRTVTETLIGEAMNITRQRIDAWLLDYRASRLAWCVANKSKILEAFAKWGHQ